MKSHAIVGTICVVIGMVVGRSWPTPNRPPAKRIVAVQVQPALPPTCVEWCGDAGVDCVRRMEFRMARRPAGVGTTCR